MLNGDSAKKPTKFWLSPSDQAIRLELPDGSATYATLSKFGDSLNWHYGEPSERIDAAALEAVIYEYTCSVGSLVFGGYESVQEMDRQCSARCQTCHAVGESHESLSEEGECPRCFVARMADDLVVYPADYVSPESKREIERTTAECLAPGGSF